jgi:energy-coupling factor transporter ATP-binding protein EcfA2
LFKLVESQRRKIAEQAVLLRSEGKTSMPLDFPDPVEPFKRAFAQLLAPKRLVDVDVRTQTMLYELDGEKRPIETLSSGEREVVNIVFDFLLRNPSDCIVFFDEPELHLHPELSYKLLQTLSLIGKNNQFVFCTHSPEIITASIENSVVFITPRKKDKSNQALVVSRGDTTHHALNLLGQSIGIISLGKKLLLIEGDESSLDKQTYGAILQNEFPELVMVPVGGKSTIRSFEEIRKSVLNQTIWGVEFFMLCDRDAVYEIGVKSFTANSSERLQVLPRYHLENYFLEEGVLVGVFEEMEQDRSSWLRSEERVREALREIAAQTIPYAVALKVAAHVRESVGNIDIMPSGITGPVDKLVALLSDQTSHERERIAGNLDITPIESLCRDEFAKFEKSIAEGSEYWKQGIPGRIVLNRFAGKAQISVGRLKTLYLRHAHAATTDPFSEIRAIFRRFRTAASGSTNGTNGIAAT